MIYPYYRISDKPALKVKNKPSYITNEKCLHNFLTNFGPENLHVIADSVNKCTKALLASLSQQFGFTYEVVYYGNGSETFLHALEMALMRENNDIIYFVEDDFLHLPDSRRMLAEAFKETDADYVTLYDHPDKYINRIGGSANPFIQNGGELTRVIRTSTSHWKITNSTVMTFAARVRTLREDERVWRWCAAGRVPRDFRAFCKLNKRRMTVPLFKPKRKLIHPIPGWATHGEKDFLSPFVNWENM